MRKRRALVVDDVELNLVILRDVLEVWGYDCQTAKDGFDAVSLFEKSDFDIIFMDIEMPGMSGLDASRAIRKLEQRSSHPIPIIAHTAYGVDEYAKDCKDAGMTGCIAKPYDFAEIRALAENLIRMVAA